MNKRFLFFTAWDFDFVVRVFSCKSQDQVLLMFHRWSMITGWTEDAILSMDKQEWSEG